jgi:hypothetical protein
MIAIGTVDDRDILERDFAAVDVVRNLIVDEVAVDITPCLKPGGSLAGHTAGRQSVVRYQESRIHLDGIFFCEPHFYASTRRKFVCVTTVKFLRANDKIAAYRNCHDHKMCELISMPMKWVSVVATEFLNDQRRPKSETAGERSSTA